MAFCVAALVAAPADAQSETDRDLGDAAPAADASRGVGAGAFMPFTWSARSDTQRGLGFMQGGYDSARKGSVFHSVAEAQLFDRVSARGGATYLGPTGKLRPDFAIKVDALRQERHGIDMAVAVGYEAQGFNLLPAVVARLAAARAFGRARLLGNVGYGAATAEGDRFGDLRLAGLVELTRDLHVGVDSRFRIDLERDNDEPAGEPEYELDVGPLAAYAHGRFLVTASGGASALKYRFVEPRRVGLLGMLGLGAVF